MPPNRCSCCTLCPDAPLSPPWYSLPKLSVLLSLGPLSVQIYIPVAPVMFPGPFLLMWLSPTFPKKEEWRTSDSPHIPNALHRAWHMCWLYEYIWDWMQPQDSKEPNFRCSVSWAWGLQSALRTRLNSSWPSGSSHWPHCAMSIREQKWHSIPRATLFLVLGPPGWAPKNPKSPPNPRCGTSFQKPS